MPEDEKDKPFVLALFTLLFLITGQLVAGDSLDTDRNVLLNLKSFLEERNPVNKGSYSGWNNSSSNPCSWNGVTCNNTKNRVTSVNLSANNIAGDFFGSFSQLTELTYLDLSVNSIGKGIPEDLGHCKNLKFLNLSHNLIDYALNLTGLTSLEVLDLSQNRIQGSVRSAIPGIGNSLRVANLSNNAFSGDLGTAFEGCLNLKYLDLSTNNLTGGLWYGFDRLVELSLSGNHFTGNVPSSFITRNCSLQTLDFSENQFFGNVPMEISYCKSLQSLNLWSNSFSGPIPGEIGSISGLQALYFGSNNFSSDIPESLVGLSNLTFLDLSDNNFGGEIQSILGQFKQVKFLVLHGNSYSGGLYTSGILNLTNIYRLDLSYNNLSGPLPVEVSQMPNLMFLILAYNQFTGPIPSEYGNFQGIQVIDLSYNRLNGSIPSSLGKLSSLLWLMLANNELSGEIPPEFGNCSSLLWLNLANNQLSGPIPPQLTNIGADPTPTFLFNKQNYQTNAGRGGCLTMRRWIPADYAPFSFVFKLLTTKKCSSLWDMLLTGYGLFQFCRPGTNARTSDISGYLQLSGNQLSGIVPTEIGNMHNFSMLHLGMNGFYGQLPSQIGQMGLVVLNLTRNNFSGEIPTEIGGIKCLLNLDFSYNNFSGDFPASLNNLTDLTKFNISYNPYISGAIPDTGQLATFDKWSFLGDPHLRLPSFIANNSNGSQTGQMDNKHNRSKLNAFLVFLAVLMAFLVCGVLTLIACLVLKNPTDASGYLLEGSKGMHELVSTSSFSSPWPSDSVKVIRLDKTAFTHSDILQATCNFSHDRIIGRGGYGIVYRGVLPDGTEVAVKKAQRDGLEGEKEFQAEMEVLSGNGFGWPHPNLVTLYGWCLDGSEKLLVYEYMEGGSLEDHITDRIKLTWRRRIEVAIDVARALVYLHHECYPPIVHRDVKASNVLLDKNGKARVTDFGLARVINPGGSHVSTMVAGTVGYVAPEYGQTWHATTKGDVYSYGVLIMELATGRRAVDGGEECLLDWARRVMGDGRQGFTRSLIPVAFLVSGLEKGAEQMCELLQIGIRCTAESPHLRPNMKEVLAMLFGISGKSGSRRHRSSDSSPPTN
ncbi:OLC1v1012377C1 [Oldenlandia corymbosa var. corymbosa]|uniref:non-specific serine/threonine protein kinase n=1 Tax=Oldenlandia corymbosa var. corymbosa TaxID=529605 RepID=A0AAV1DVX1_OLDCO|nr:OLC1v1012377C1 [Oldenlandia corymbosa var. corymbosa]